MIISRTPFRVSLFGGGTDYPAHYLKHGGATLGFAINRYCHISIRHLPPFFQHRTRVVHSKIELVQDHAAIEHRAVRAVLTELAPMIKGDGLEIHHFGDLPHMSGVGSSSSFTVGLLNAVHALYGRSPPPGALAHEATRIERDVIGEVVGSQDQCFAAFGGLNQIDFNAIGSAVITPLRLRKRIEDALLAHLILAFTGISRVASNVAAAQVARTRTNLTTLLRMRDLVDDARARLIAGDVPVLGPLLHESWLLKRGLAPNVSTSAVDDIYAAARAAGATGGKLLGAGGGGFLLIFCPPARRYAVMGALLGLVIVPVGIDRAGSVIVLNEPNGLG
jgi:D-glycero-alpha-D-manno-heptose-7-phosphate kinase